MSTTTSSPPALTQHQLETLLYLGRSLIGSQDWVRGSDIGSAGALDHLFRKGYANRKTDHGPRGGTVVWYNLTQDGRHVYDRHAQVPANITEYFDEPTARPRIEQVFIEGTGWKRTGWFGQVITRSVVRELRRAKATHVAVKHGVRVADFVVKELTR